MPNIPLFLDFETEAIGLRPVRYPPIPVGYAYKANGSRGYVSWGHPGRNSHTASSAKLMLHGLLSGAGRVVCHNHGFDREVAQAHMALDHDRWEDTMFLAFLADPYGQLSLKPLAEKHLGMPPEERDAVRDWLVAHGVCRPNDKDWGAHICDAPASVVGPYAIGDVVRTERLWKHWQAFTAVEAYDNELRLTPIITEMERAGVRLDMDALRRDVDAYFKVLDSEDKAVKKVLGEVDLDKDQDVASALDKKRKLSSPLPLTEKGAVSVGKRALIACVKDKELLGTLLMRNSLATCLRTFMQPWLEAQVGGTLHFRFNQIRNERGLGARTGRMSSSPNMMNVPSKWEALYAVLDAIGYRRRWLLPNVRRYILPDKGGKIVSVDYNQQEMRLFAHFEDGALMEEYRRNPRIDAHQMVADLSGLSRKAAKTLNFAELYGAGLAVIMEQLDCTEGEARSFKQSYRRALPGVKDLKDSIEDIIKRGDPISTIGGRDYYPEPPKMVKGRMRDFNYKMLNYLIQGSAADQSKLAMIDFARVPGSGRLMFPVHDELVISAPAKHAEREARRLADSMTASYSKSLDVPFLTDIKIGDNYGEF